MIRLIIHLAILISLATAVACGGSQRRPVNDEVTTRMNPDDEAALDTAPQLESPDHEPGEGIVPRPLRTEEASRVTEDIGTP